MFLGGIPIIAVVSGRSAKMRALCWTALVAFIAVGDMSGVNFLSTESYRGTDRGFELTFTDMFVLGLLLSGSFGAQRLRLSKRKMAPGLPLFLVYLAYSLLGIAGSIMPLYGFFTLWKMLRMVLLYATVWKLGRSEPDPAVFFGGVLRGLVIGLLAVGLLGMKQKFVDGMYRVKGTFDHSNTIPLFVNLAAAPVFAWILGDGKMGRLEFLVGFGAVGASLVAILATQSRLGILLAGICIGTSLIIANRTKEASLRTRAAAVVFVMAATVGGILVSDTLLNRIKNAPESSAAARDEFNVAAQEMAADKFFGVGLNNFPITMTNVEKYRIQVEVMANEEESGVAHHLYFLTMAECGYIGLFLLVLTFLLVLFSYLGFIFRKRTREEKAALGFLPGVVTAALLGQLALFVSCFFEWAFRITPVISQYFLTSGLICVAISRAGEKGPGGLGIVFDRKKEIA